MTTFHRALLPRDYTLLGRQRLGRQDFHLVRRDRFDLRSLRMLFEIELFATPPGTHGQGVHIQVSYIDEAAYDEFFFFSPPLPISTELRNGEPMP